jgi:acid phosphatase
LATAGVALTQSYAVAHPSQPNYLALFSGSTQGLRDDSCPHSFSGPNLASELSVAGRSFVGYSESLPSTGYTGCDTDTGYARKHNPWVNFPALPATVNQPLTDFPTDYARLPDISFVIPNLDHDMHDGSVEDGDRWLRAELGGYVEWAPAHDSLLVITADEDDGDGGNRIPTILLGAHLGHGSSAERIDHYGLLRTLLDSFSLPAMGAARAAAPLRTVWAA